MKEYEDLKDKEFNHLTVLRKSDKVYKSRATRWVCICDCGSGIERHIPTTRLINNLTVSCGCIRGNKKGCTNPKTAKKLYKGFMELSGTYWGVIKSGAKIRNLEFSITKEDAWNQFIKQDKKCALSGFDLWLDKSYGSDCKRQTASLDRIDSTKGYTVDNIQWIHKTINPMKMDMKENDFLYWCSIISKHRRLMT